MSTTCKKGHLILKESCRECQALRKEWYSYLKAEGFEDAEDPKHNWRFSVPYIITDDSPNNVAQHPDRKLFERRSYYLWASQKLNDGRFQCETDKLIWEMHSEGASRREIAPRVGYEQSWITRKIQKIEMYLKCASSSFVASVW